MVSVIMLVVTFLGLGKWQIHFFWYCNGFYHLKDKALGNENLQYCKYLVKVKCGNKLNLARKQPLCELLLTDDPNN